MVITHHNIPDRIPIGMVITRGIPPAVFCCVIVMRHVQPDFELSILVITIFLWLLQGLAGKLVKTVP